MKLFEVLFLFESDDLFVNKEPDKKTMKLKVQSLAIELERTPKDSPRYEVLARKYQELDHIVNPKKYPNALQGPRVAFNYARDEIEGRFYMGEKILLTSPFYASLYASHILNKRWPEAEAIIATEDQAAYNYIESVLKKRWPEAEPTLFAGHAVYSFPYIQQYIKHRVPEAEAVIMDSSFYAFQYAKYIIKGRWPEAEATIRSAPSYRKQYDEFVQSLE
jgi:hypothetical protein